MTFEQLRDMIWNREQFQYEGAIRFCPSEGVYAALKEGIAEIGGRDTACICRALTEFACHVRAGKTSFRVKLEPQFRWCGTMLDMSRDGVMRVETVKEYLLDMAALGMNMLMLYTEDIFEMKKYPFFGHKRGRYTIEELQEIDDYAYELGIEVIPCVQTLGHLNSYLPWAEAGKIRDTGFNILPCDEGSYEFIEEILKTMRAAFRSQHIHIGMDEAVDVGKGVYFDRHRGEVIDQYELLLEHLHGVCRLCEKYDYEPIMWSDLLFTIYNPGHSEIFTKDMILPEEAKKRIPHVRLMYWYYSSQSRERYETLLRRHKETGKPIAFAGAGWNWEGYAPNHKFAFDCMIPALEACVNENPEMLLNTLWGNGGCETSFFLCHPSNALFAEYHYYGAEAQPERAWELCELVTGSPREVYEAMDCLNYGLYGNQIIGRKLLRCDVLGSIVGVSDDGYVRDNMPEVFQDGEPAGTFRKAAEYLRGYIAQNGDWKEYYELEATVLETAAGKAEVFAGLQKAYRTGERELLQRFADNTLPALKVSYERLYQLQKQQWMREYKAFGWEKHCQRFGYQILRIEYAIEVLTQYLAGELTVIEELEAEYLDQHVIEYDASMFD